MREAWRAIEGFEGCYEISSLGRVMAIGRVVPNGPNSVRKTSTKVLAQYTHSGGYLCVKLCVGQEKTSHYVHRLVCRAFHGDPAENQEALHRDGVKTNNITSNLRWGTRIENIADNGLHGVKPVGERHGRAVLSAADVGMIRAATGLQREIAARFGISREMVGRILRRQNWTHI